MIDRWKRSIMVTFSIVLGTTFIGCLHNPQELPTKPQADQQTVIEEWNSIQPPSAPELKVAQIDSKTTALLVLDMQTALCKNPRSIGTIATIQRLLNEARTKGMLVVYSLTSNGNIHDIVPELALLPKDPVVKSSVDKFYNTNLEQLLKDHHITTVIITGTAANGAVLHTATAASIRGIQVVVPIEGMFANDRYAEQYTVWHLVNAPGTRNKVTLTKESLLSIGGE